jgi:hypothetical protein
MYWFLCSRFFLPLLLRQFLSCTSCNKYKRFSMRSWFPWGLCLTTTSQSHCFYIFLSWCIMIHSKIVSATREGLRRTIMVVLFLLSLVPCPSPSLMRCHYHVSTSRSGTAHRGAAAGSRPPLREARRRIEEQMTRSLIEIKNGRQWKGRGESRVAARWWACSRRRWKSQVWSPPRGTRSCIDSSCTAIRWNGRWPRRWNATPCPICRPKRDREVVLAVW